LTYEFFDFVRASETRRLQISYSYDGAEREVTTDGP
jgi:hypothetical protein